MSEEKEDVLCCQKRYFGICPEHGVSKFAYEERGRKISDLENKLEGVSANDYYKETLYSEQYVDDLKAKLSQAERERGEERKVHELTKVMYEGITEAGMEKASKDQDVMKYKHQRDEARRERDDYKQKFEDNEAVCDSQNETIVEMEACGDCADLKATKQRLEGLQGAVEEFGYAYNEPLKFKLEEEWADLSKAYEASKEKP